MSIENFQTLRLEEKINKDPLVIFYTLDTMTDYEMDSTLKTLSTNELLEGLKCYLPSRVKQKIMFNVAGRWSTFTVDNLANIDYEMLKYMLSLDSYNYSCSPKNDLALENSLAGILVAYFTLTNSFSKENQFMESISLLRYEKVSSRSLLTIYNLNIVRESVTLKDYMYNILINSLQAFQTSTFTQATRFPKTDVKMNDANLFDKLAFWNELKDGDCFDHYNKFVGKWMVARVFNKLSNIFFLKYEENGGYVYNITFSIFINDPEFERLGTKTKQ